MFVDKTQTSTTSCPQRAHIFVDKNTIPKTSCPQRTHIFVQFGYTDMLGWGQAVRSCMCPTISSTTTVKLTRVVHGYPVPSSPRLQSISYHMSTTAAYVSESMCSNQQAYIRHSFPHVFPQCHVLFAKLNALSLGGSFIRHHTTK